MSQWSHDSGDGHQGQGAVGAHRRDQGGGPAPAGYGGSVRAVTAGHHPPAGYGVVRHLPLLPEPRGPPDGPHRRRLRRPGDGRRGRRRPVSPGDFGGRWRTVGLAVRDWAVANPHEYALLYGSPVPGYRAPDDTVGPAARVTLVFARIVDQAARSGNLTPVATGPELPPPDAEVLGRLAGARRRHAARTRVRRGPRPHGLDAAVRHGLLRTLRPSPQRRRRCAPRAGAGPARVRTARRLSHRRRRIRRPTNRSRSRSGT